MAGAAGDQDIQDGITQGNGLSFSCQESRGYSVVRGGRTGVGRCAASLAGGISGQPSRGHRRFPGRPGL